ncbi:MAG: SIS domain-containing protein, partial [Clostridia bacterium]|nr:SIS domain-containing protein [Clostridia bacterium]
MYMQQELFSEPSVIRNALNNNKAVVAQIANTVKSRGISNITIIGRGTSDNAGLCFKYITEILCGIPCGTAHPSVTTMFGAKVNYNNHLVVAVSQSGKSIDTLAVLQEGKATGAVTVAVTNDVASPLAKAADFVLDLSAGEEKSVAATKTYAAELTVLYALAVAISGKKELEAVLEKLPEKVSDIIGLQLKIRQMAEACTHENNFIVLSRGPMQGVGKEMALKLGECCYSYGHFFSVTDFMHGPLALLEEGSNVVVLAPKGECSENFVDIATRARLLGANVYAFSDIPDVLNIANVAIKMPPADFITSTLTYAMA